MADDAHKQSVVVSGGKGRFVFPKKIVLICLAVIAVVGLVAAIPSSRQFINKYVGVTTPQKTGPCSSNADLLARYNKTVKEKGVTELATIASEVRALPNYATDPTCVYISMVAGYGDTASENEHQEYERLLSLKATGKGVSSQVDDGIDAKNVQKAIKQQEQDKATGGTGGQG